MRPIAELCTGEEADRQIQSHTLTHLNAALSWRTAPSPLDADRGDSSWEASGDAVAQARSLRRRDSSRRTPDEGATRDETREEDGA
jgi:hypothetical protein